MAIPLMVIFFFHYFGENEGNIARGWAGAEKQLPLFSWGLSSVHLCPWGEWVALSFPVPSMIHCKPNSFLGSHDPELVRAGWYNPCGLLVDSSVDM